MIVLRAHFEPTQISSNQRGRARRKLHLKAQGFGVHGSSEVIILDLSTTGLLLETSDTLTVGEAVDLDLQNAEVIRAVVKWSSGPFFGCQFRDPISPATVSAALLRAAPAPVAASHAVVPTLVALNDEEERNEDPQPKGTLSFNAKMRWILAFSVVSWGLIGALVSLAWPYFH